MRRAEKERKKTSSKIPLLLLQTRGNQPCFRTALWGSDGTSLSCPSPHLNIFILVPTFISCWFRPARAEWVTVFCISPPAEECWSSTSSVAGLEGQAGCEQEWLVECKGGETEEKKTNNAHYVLDNMSAPLQDGKSEPVPSDYLPGNFLELFLILYIVQILVPGSPWWGNISCFWSGFHMGQGLQQMKCKRLVEGCSIILRCSSHVAHVKMPLLPKGDRFWRLSEGMKHSLTDAWSVQPPGIPKIRPPWTPGLCGGAMLPWALKWLQIRILVTQWSKRSEETEVFGYFWETGNKNIFKGF